MAEIVVDTSVVRSCGDQNATSSQAIDCRNILEYLLLHRVTLILSKEIYDEWFKFDPVINSPYISRYARLWLKKMNDRKLIKNIQPTKYNQIRECSEKMLITAHKNQFMKDLHLFEAALDSCNRIVSKENICWIHARSIVECSEILRRIHWVSPHDLRSLIWIQDGLPDDSYWCM
jgi:hypothetical protein